MSRVGVGVVVNNAKVKGCQSLKGRSRLTAKEPPPQKAFTDGEGTLN